MRHAPASVHLRGEVSKPGLRYVAIGFVETSVSERRRAVAPLAIVSDCVGLVEAMRLQAERLNLPRDVIGELSGLTDKHAGKILAD